MAHIMFSWQMKEMSHNVFVSSLISTYTDTLPEFPCAMFWSDTGMMFWGILFQSSDGIIMGAKTLMNMMSYKSMTSSIILHRNENQATGICVRSYKSIQHCTNESPCYKSTFGSMRLQRLPIQMPLQSICDDPLPPHTLPNPKRSSYMMMYLWKPLPRGEPHLNT